jgi:hypothetical protein
MKTGQDAPDVSLFSQLGYWARPFSFGKIYFTSAENLILNRFHGNIKPKTG